MSLAVNLAEFALILMFLVLVHEAGHMVVLEKTAAVAQAIRGLD